MEHCGSHLDDEMLRTFMCEAAAIVNSRPLTVANIHDPNSLEPLTPNHLLTMKSFYHSQDNSREKTCIRAKDGEEYSTLLTNFGSVGGRNS